MGRFADLVDTPEGIESFKTQYRIPPGVSIRYCCWGEWHTMRWEGEVVIPMIAPNMFRILGSVDALNEKMGVNLTHHDVNWIYNCHKLTG